VSKKEKIFLILAIFFCLMGFTCVNLVSSAVAKYIGRNGWKAFNRGFIPILSTTGVAIAGYVFSRFRLRWPTWKEWLFAAAGAIFSFYTISRTLLLTTELVHIPQFAVCAILFSAAFPRNRDIAAGLSAVACIADEWSQSFFPNRVVDINDVFLNFIGLYVGLIVWWAISAKASVHSAAPPDDH
jgi:hypothetical protein